MLRDVAMNEKTEKGWTFSNLSPRKNSPCSDRLSGCPVEPSWTCFCYHGASRNKRDSPFAPHDQPSAFGIRTDRIEFIPLLLTPPDAMRIIGQLEIKNEILPHDEQAFGRDRLYPDLLAVCLACLF